MKNLLLILSIVLIFTACSEDSTRPKDTPNPSTDGVFYFNQFDMNDWEVPINIAKFNIETASAETIIESARLYSAPVNGKMVFTQDSVVGKDPRGNAARSKKIIVANIDGSNPVLIDQCNQLEDDFWISFPKLSPDANKVLYAKYGTEEEWEEMLICDLDGNNKSVIYDKEFDSYTLSFSNDGSKIAFFDNDENLIIFDITSKSIIAELENIETIEDLSSSIIWTPDDSKIIFTSTTTDDNNLDIVVVNSNGTNLNRIHDERGHYFVALSTDGTTLAYNQEDAETRRLNIVVSDIDGNNSEVILEGTLGEHYFSPIFCPDGETMIVLTTALDIEECNGFAKVDLVTKQFTKISDMSIFGCFFEK